MAGAALALTSRKSEADGLYSPQLLPINAKPTLFNADPSFLMKWRKALANTRAGVSNSRIVLLGASNIRGAYSNNSTFQGIYTNAIESRLVKAFSRLGIQANNDSFFGDSGIGLAAKVQYDTRLVYGSSWATAFAGDTFANAFIVASTNTNSIAFTPTTAGLDTFELVHTQNSSQGIASVDFNGAGGGTQTQNATPAGTIRTTFTGAAGAYPINIKWSSGGNVYVHGGLAYLSTQKTVNILNVGWDGSGSANWTSPPILAGFTASKLGQNLTIICGDMSINDLQAGLTNIQTIQANMQAIITDALLAGDVMLITVNPVVTSLTNCSVANQLALNAMMKSLANINSLWLVDFYARYGGTFAAMNTAGWYGDGGSAHPGQAGYDDNATFLAEILSGP